MGGVFDHLQAVALRDGQDGRHVGRQAGVVHRQDRLGARRDRRLDGEAVDVQRGRVDVDQLHVGAEVAHHLGRGGEGVRGGDDLVAGADADGLERQVQPGGGRVDGQAVQAGIAEKGREVGLEALGLGPGGDPARPQRVDDFGDLFLADVGQREGQERGDGCELMLLLDPGQDMRAQQRHRIEQRIKPRMDPAHGTRQRRRQRDAPRRDARLREKRPHLGQRHAAHVGVARVVDGEVVPQHRPAGGQPAPHGSGQRRARGSVEQRAEDGGLQHQVLAAWRYRSDDRVALDQAQRSRQHVARLREAFGQQLDAGHVLGRKTQPQQLEQVAAAATADLEHALVGERSSSRRARTAPASRAGAAAPIARHRAAESCSARAPRGARSARPSRRGRLAIRS